MRTSCGWPSAAIAVMGLGSAPCRCCSRSCPPPGSLRVLSVPLPWLLLGVAVYPLLVASRWCYVRASERIERDFADLVERR